MVQIYTVALFLKYQYHDLLLFYLFIYFTNKKIPEIKILQVFSFNDSFIIFADNRISPFEENFIAFVNKLIIICLNLILSPTTILYLFKLFFYYYLYY